MAFLKSFLELPWICALILSYFGAGFNNSHRKGLEIFAPVFVCALALAGSYYLSLGNEFRSTGYVTILRFALTGFFGILLTHYLWGEYGTLYLKETAMGVVPAYLFSIMLTVIAVIVMSVSLWRKM